MTDDVASLKKELESIEEEIHILRERRAEIREKLAAAISPVAVGDSAYLANKPEQIWLITSVRLGYSDKPEYWGRKYKKDGTPGATIHSIYQAFGTQMVKTEPPAPRK